MALTNMTVNVTRDHIRDGVAGDACKCAIACAVIDALLEQDIIAGIWVLGPAPEFSWHVYAEQRDATGVHQWIAPLEDETALWIYHFDVGEPVSPIEIELIWRPV